MRGFSIKEERKSSMLRLFRQRQPEKSKAITPTELTQYPMPRHVAIIMDGNGRWAKKRGLPRAAGHRSGAEALRGVVKACGDLGIPYLTVYAFSTENWKRPQEEIDALMGLLIEYIEKELDVLNKNEVRIKAIGNLNQLPEKAVKLIENAERKTAANKRLYLQIALNYGGRKDIIRAVQQLAADVLAGKVRSEQIEEQLFASYLSTGGIPEPDLIIRTAGEKRLSNFLLWECAYSEFWFHEVLWPDFHKEHLFQAIYDFQHRQRRFGGLVNEENK
jgi:undecaprenyl diphosphate synthase